MASFYPQSTAYTMNNDHNQPRYSRSVSKFDVGNIIGDPFFLTTIGIGFLAWIIAFVTSAISDANGSFPNFAWWAVVYELFCILGVTVVVASNSIYSYNVAIVGYLSSGLVLTSSSANTLIYQKSGTEQAAAAGHILLSMISVLWIFYFGTSPTAVTHHYIDSFAQRPPPSEYGTHPTSYYDSRRPETTISNNVVPQMYTSAQLSGLEATSPLPMGGSVADRSSQAPKFGAPPGTSGGASGSMLAKEEDQMDKPTEYPYRAKAIYSYTANPEDANEISFQKHDILEVSDVSGRWWQARKESGETGIAPSNYLILL
ncbi:Transmembrane osmosensor [Orbilia javanica]|uniref:Transmembrane osmosensor n=1 Tax=Orbilia javanica TaxID=47235 RepID=A0AAN8MSI4_9PEZI